MLVLALVAGQLAALRSSMSAMACCAKTHNECAGVKTPDDCCRGMGHSISSSPSTAPIARDGLMSLPLAVVPVVAIVATPSSTLFVTDSTFKRPHDPPHLHPISLLI